MPPDRRFDWDFFSDHIDVNLFNAPASFLITETGVSASVGLSLLRKGTAYTGLSAVSVLEQRQLLDADLWYDLAPFFKEASDFTASTDLSVALQPRLNWTARTGSTLNTVVALTTWSDPAQPGVLFQWVPTAPYTAKTLRLPNLTAAMGPFHFPSQGELSAPVLIAMDATWHTSYQDFITHEVPLLTLLSGRLQGPHFRFMLHTATVVASTVHPTPPAAGALLERLPSVRALVAGDR